MNPRERKLPNDGPSRRLRWLGANAPTTVAAVVLMVLAVSGIAVTRPSLARTAHEVRETDETFALPPPQELRAATLGYDAATVDLLWADLLVEAGLHSMEKRDFTDIPKYLDAILELEPTYPPVYKYVTSMLPFRPIQGTEDDARMARAYMKRGTQVLPNESGIWMEYGEFIAFLGPSFLHDDAEKNSWRIDGARAMAHAVELGADPERALSASALLTHAGDKRETIDLLSRTYAQTEGLGMEEVHRRIGESLAALQASDMYELADQTYRAIEARRKKHAPGVDFGLYLLLGPGTDAFGCAGAGGYGGAGCERPECCRDWGDALRETVSSPGSSADSP